MQPTVQMIGLDFGTTTSAAVVAEGWLTRNAVTGRTDLDGLRERFRSDLIFTPFIGEQIDIDAIDRQLDAWFAAGSVRPDAIFGGGALLTGLTAQRGNADELVTLIRKRLGDTLIATANDPCLESWLAFMGSAAELSRSMPDRRVFNLDIGGGTTNLALGQAGEVLRTECLYVGARHVQCEPGTYRVVRLSKYAKALFDSFGIGENELTSKQVDRITSIYMSQLESAMRGQIERAGSVSDGYSKTVAYASDSLLLPIITLSGGVGELVYAHFDGKPWPSTTAFGDLGIDLAKRLVESKWADELCRYRPASAGRATVFGLLRHSTEISGSTLYLPNPRLLPLNDLPILGTMSSNSNDEDIQTLLQLAARSERGACLRVDSSDTDAMTIRLLGQRIASALRIHTFPDNRVLVLLVGANVGKALGQYASDWGRLPVELLVIDEVPTRDAQFARIGAMKQQVVPVSFYGLYESGVMR
jgi:ethanolamine utilization protein EutA